MQQAIALLRLAKQKLESLAEPARPLAGSVLDEEGRRHTTYERMDGVVVQHRARAIDNLERAFDLMFDVEKSTVLAYPYSLYSLIRTAIESAALALWIIDSERKATRVLRSLQLTYRDTLERRQFLEFIAPEEQLVTERAREQKVIARLVELKDTVGALKQKPLTGPPKYTEILKSISTRTKGDARSHYSPTSPLVVWKVCSAFIHGSGQLIQALSDFRQVTEFQDGVATVEVTPSMRMLAGAIDVTVDLIARADQRLVQLATHDYAGRPIAADLA